MSVIIGIGTSNGVFLLSSPRVGEAWKTVAQGLVGKEVTCLTPTQNGVLLAGTAPGTLYQTRDFENWDPLYTGITHPAVHSVAVDPVDPSTIYCGTSPVGLFRSRDGGGHFELMPTLHQQPTASQWGYPTAPYMPRLHRLVLHPARPSVILAGIRRGGFYVSGDSGETWRDRSQGSNRDLLDFQLHPAEPSRIYAATATGYFRSEDLGGTWQSSNQGLTHLLAGPLAVATEEPSAVFMAIHATAEGGAYLMRSSNGGGNWKICPGTLPYAPARAVTALISGRGVVFLGTNQGELFATTNFGGSWQLVRSQFPPVRSLSIVYQS